MTENSFATSSEPTSDRATWLSPEILRWPAEQCEWTHVISQLGQIANNEWNHGHLRLNSAIANGPNSEEDRKDAIAAFWRAVERRQQLFDEVYAVRVLLGLGRRERIHLSHLQALGLIRGSVLDDIRRLRNAIEHESEAPPELSQCFLYQDAIWYFLRSTEPYARRIPTAYELIEDHESYSRGEIQERIEIKMSPLGGTLGSSVKRYPQTTIQLLAVRLGSQ
jgi:hypothetical protein